MSKLYNPFTGEELVVNHAKHDQKSHGRGKARLNKSEQAIMDHLDKPGRTRFEAESKSEKRAARSLIKKKLVRKVELGGLPPKQFFPGKFGRDKPFFKRASSGTLIVEKVE